MFFVFSKLQIVTAYVYFVLRVTNIWIIKPWVFVGIKSKANFTFIGETITWIIWRVHFLAYTISTKLRVHSLEQQWLHKMQLQMFVCDAHVVGTLLRNRRFIEDRRMELALFTSKQNKTFHYYEIMPGYQLFSGFLYTRLDTFKGCYSIIFLTELRHRSLARHLLRHLDYDSSAQVFFPIYFFKYL